MSCVVAMSEKCHIFGYLQIGRPPMPRGTRVGTPVCSTPKRIRRGQASMDELAIFSNSMVIRNKSDSINIKSKYQNCDWSRSLDIAYRERIHGFRKDPSSGTSTSRALFVSLRGMANEDLIVSHIVKTYPTARDDLSVLSDLSFALNRRESLAVTGPSGIGKSTLLHILGTLDRPTSGSVRLLEEDPFALNEAGQARFRSKHIGFIFQDHHLMPQLNVLENTLLPALAIGRIGREHTERAQELLEAVGLSDRLTHLPSELSGGERERVAVARSMLLRPTLILADEPTGNLDPQNAQKIGQLLLDLQQRENTLLVVVTHSMELASKMSRQLPLSRVI